MGFLDQPQQAEMDLGDVAAAVFADGEAGYRECTGQRLAKNEPDKYAACIIMLGRGFGVHRVARALGIGVNTVSAIRDEAAPDVETEKLRVATKCRRGAELMLERLIDMALDPNAKIPANVAAISAGILIDKAQVLTGQATSIIRHERAEFSHEDFNDYLASLQAVEPDQPGQSLVVREDAGKRDPGPAAPASSPDQDATEAPGA